MTIGTILAVLLATGGVALSCISAFFLHRYSRWHESGLLMQASVVEAVAINQNTVAITAVFTDNVGQEQRAQFPMTEQQASLHIGPDGEIEIVYDINQPDAQSSARPAALIRADRTIMRMTAAGAVLFFCAAGLVWTAGF